jgi:hypothetical protein
VVEVGVAFIGVLKSLALAACVKTFRLRLTSSVASPYRSLGGSGLPSSLTAVAGLAGSVLREVALCTREGGAFPFVMVLDAVPELVLGAPLGMLMSPSKFCAVVMDACEAHPDEIADLIASTSAATISSKFHRCRAYIDMASVSSSRQWRCRRRVSLFRCGTSRSTRQPAAVISGLFV